MNRRLTTWISAGVVAIGSLIAIIFVLQPWRSCPYEDTAAGCAMLPRDAAVMTADSWLR